MALLITLCLSFVVSVLAGSECPTRENIYPCSCLSIPQGKRAFFTSVTCHRLPSTDAFDSILPALKSMAIDRFYLYDSFWEAHKAANEDKKTLPSDWLTMLKIKELEIVDTTLSACFACNAKVRCRNDITTRFTAVNSSSHDKICTLCDFKGASKFTWIGCMSKLQSFHFRHGGLTEFRDDMFLLPMLRLTELDLSYNSIAKIGDKVLANLPKLKVLKLSHNALQSLAGLTASKLADLQELDVSWNILSSFNANLFAALPSLKTLVANNNNIEFLKEEQLKRPPDTLRLIDLTENPVHCDCDMKWLNTTFPTYTVIRGHCVTPEEYESIEIRRASRYLNERCSEDGKIGTRKKTPKAAVTVPMKS